MVKLEHCPFCGSKTAYISQNYMGQHYVRCPDCGCTMWGLDTDEEVTEKQAAACWNKRADVRPVVRGRWIDMGDFEQCSHCTGTHLKKIQTVYGKAIWIKSDFCPNCGADMREEPPEEGET